METATDKPMRSARGGSKNRLGDAPEMEQRPVAREMARTPERHGRAVALDRDGKPLSRRRDNTEDQFHIPDELKETGWDYQWNVKSVTGEEQVSTQIRDMENGWRPIMSDRDGFAGRFMPEGHKGAIERGGLVLCERPMVLTEEARREDRLNAKNQRHENRRRFGLPQLPEGFEDRNDRLGQ